ncbi:MAG: hypothetical protein NZ828_08295 [Alphaproteobacteria bacterium]|nr:hypothetical protein [Alphaproteobacteria bacterium]
MSDFNIFHPDEQNMLAGSLYKVGVWMSHIDDDGACEADEKERLALQKYLKKSVSKFSSHPIISEMAGEALRRQKYWPRWEQDSDHALDDVKKAIGLLDGRLVDNEVKAYKELVMGIATYIAGAFDENEDDEEKGMWGALSNMVVGVANPQLKKEMRTSPSEDDALTALTAVLKTKRA